MPAAQLAPATRETLLGQALLGLGQAFLSPSAARRQRAEEGLLQLLDMVTTAL
jgi:hypothetical protein